MEIIMKKFEGILICTDLDGTLLRDDGTISEENLTAIKYFKENGGIFTFITGRMPYFVSDIYTKIEPNAPFGCINGGGIYDHRTQKYIWTHTMPDGVIDLVEYADKNVEGIGIQVNTFEKIYFCAENEAMAEFREVTGMPNLVAHYRDVTEPVGKIVFGDTREEAIRSLAALLDRHPRAGEFDFIRSAKTLYEILPKGTNKGCVLPRLAAHLGIDYNKTIAIGDYNNDVEMLKTAHIGVAVANAVPEAKAAADYITVSNEQHAIARLISDIESGILKV